MKKVGRPTKAPKAGERVPLGLRVTAELKRRLDAASEKSGRSQSQEAEMRLERSFEKQGLLKEILTLSYGSDWAAFLSDADEAGILVFREADKEAIRERMNKFIDGLPDKAKGKGRQS